MTIAVPYDNGEIFQHFGHSEMFKLYDVKDNKINASWIVMTFGRGHSALAELLNKNRVEVLICGGIGDGAKAALADAGIRSFGGVSGAADDAVAAYLEGRLQFNPDYRCDHHDHEEGHSCEGNCCSEHSC